MLMNNSRSTLAVLCLAALYTSGDAELVGDVVRCVYLACYDHVQGQRTTRCLAVLVVWCR